MPKPDFSSQFKSPEYFEFVPIDYNRINPMQDWASWIVPFTLNMLSPETKYYLNQSNQSET